MCDDEVSEILDVNNQLQGTTENMDLISDFAVVNKADVSDDDGGDVSEILDVNNQLQEQ